MDFKLSDELLAIRETARDFAEKEIVPFADKWETENYFPREVIKKMADLGFYGTLIPEQYGGNGMGFLAGTIITEEIARASASLRVTFNMQTFGPALSILRYGTEEQKKKHIPKLVSTEHISCFAITEPNAGSDVMSMKTTAIPKGDYFLVNGSKTWISNAQVADLCILYAYHDPAAKSKGLSTFLLDMHLPGISTRPLDKLGLHSAPTGEIILEDVKVPKSAVLGQLGDGVKHVFGSLNQTRLSCAAGGLGIAQASLDAAVKYCNERSQFGQRIGEFQMNQDMIADHGHRARSRPFPGLPGRPPEGRGDAEQRPRNLHGQVLRRGSCRARLGFRHENSQRLRLLHGISRGPVLQGRQVHPDRGRDGEHPEDHHRPRPAGVPQSQSVNERDAQGARALGVKTGSPPAQG